MNSQRTKILRKHVLQANSNKRFVFSPCRSSRMHEQVVTEGVVPRVDTRVKLCSVLLECRQTIHFVVVWCLSVAIDDPDFDFRLMRPERSECEVLINKIHPLKSEAPP